MDRIPRFPDHVLEQRGGVLGFDTPGLGDQDTGLIEYLWDAKCAAAAGKWNFDDSGLPDSAAADVAIAATRAVVVVIAMDAVFAVIADVVGI